MVAVTRTHRLCWMAVALTVALASGCAGGSSDNTTTSGNPPVEGTDVETTLSAPQDSGATVAETTSSTATSDGSALDVDLMASSDLPEGIPVPVPAGGTQGSLSVFGYESYSVDYPMTMFEAVTAFYDAWFTAEGLPIEPEFGGGEGRRWVVTPLDLTVETTEGVDPFTVLISWPEG